MNEGFSGIKADEDQVEDVRPPFIFIHGAGDDISNGFTGA